jgi:hypothetical protein
MSGIYGKGRKGRKGGKDGKDGKDGKGGKGGISGKVNCHSEPSEESSRPATEDGGVDSSPRSE